MRLEGAVAVARRVEREFAPIAGDGLVGMSVAAVFSSGLDFVDG